MTISKDKTRIAISLHNETIALIDEMASYFHLTRSDIISVAVTHTANEITKGGLSDAFSPYQSKNPERQ